MHTFEFVLGTRRRFLYGDIGGYLSIYLSILAMSLYWVPYREGSFVVPCVYVCSKEMRELLGGVFSISIFLCLCLFSCRVWHFFVSDVGWYSWLFAWPLPATCHPPVVELEGCLCV